MFQGGGISPIFGVPESRTHVGGHTLHKSHWLATSKEISSNRECRHWTACLGGWRGHELPTLRPRRAKSAWVSHRVMCNSLRPCGLQHTRLLCPWEFPGKYTGVDCCFLLPGIFPSQGLNVHLLHWQADSLSLSHQGSPQVVGRRW